MTTPSPTVRDRLKVELRAAMRAKDRAATSALRAVLGAIDNAEAIAAPDAPTVGDSPIAGALTGLGAGEAVRRELSPDDIARIVAAEVADLRANAVDYERLGQAERAAELRHGADAIEAGLRTE